MLAIALYNNSQMIVGEQTSVTFIGNHADKDGGAMLADVSTIVLRIKGGNISLWASHNYHTSVTCASPAMEHASP